MIQEHRIMLEITTEKPTNDGYYYTSLLLPAKETEIQDAKQRARLIGRDNCYIDIAVTDCSDIPALVDTRLDCPTLEELSFFAQRLNKLSDIEIIALAAILEQRVQDGKYENGLPMKELINLTYGLENIMIASNVDTLDNLGQFAIENDLHLQLPGVKDVDPSLLNTAKVGEFIKNIDSGIFYNGYYVVAGEHKNLEVYDGKTLPRSEANEYSHAIFSIRLGKAPNTEQDASSINKFWFHFPMDESNLNNIINDTLDCPLSEYTCYDFISSIPHIHHRFFYSNMNINELNKLAHTYNQLKEFDQMKFKAILQGFDVETLAEAQQIINNLDSYQLAYYCNDEVDFFKEYLLNNMDSRVDPRWLKDIVCERTCMKLLERTGSKVTDYGIISNGRCNMFAPISYDDNESEDEEVSEETEEETEDQNIGGQSL